MTAPKGRSMNGRQIVAWVKRHGGLAAVHVRPVPGGWANSLVCVDGETMTTTARQDEAIIRNMEESDD